MWSGGDIDTINKMDILVCVMCRILLGHEVCDEGKW